MDDPRKAHGARREAEAEAHLVAHGLVTLLRNFSARMGELDLVMDDRGTLVIVEVRSRASARHGTAAETVGPNKQRRIVRATQVLLAARRELARRPVRFDVVAFDGDPPRLTWIKAAFDAT